MNKIRATLLDSKFEQVTFPHVNLTRSDNPSLVTELASAKAHSGRNLGGGPSYTAYVWYQFPCPIYAGFIHALPSLFVIRDGSAPDNASYNLEGSVYLIKETWDHETITWNNQPTLGGDIVTISAAVTCARGGRADASIPILFHGWSGSAYGLAMAISGGDSSGSAEMQNTFSDFYWWL
jgi:hypothetical protein